MARYFKNPPKRGKKRKTKKRRSSAQVAATKKLVAMNKAKKRKTKKKVVRRKKRSVASSSAPKRRKTRKTTKRRTTKMAKRRGTKRRRSSGRKRSGNITLRKVKGRVYATNPPFLRSIIQGGKDAAAVLAGGAAARTLSNFVPMADKTGIAFIGVQVAAAAAVGIGARKFVSGDIARMMVAGAMQVPLKALITKFAPGAAGLLGDYDQMNSYLSGTQALYSSDGASALPESGVYVGEDAEGMNAYVDAY